MEEIIQNSASLVKFFVSSRDDQDIVCRLKNVPNLYIRASDNFKDIVTFIHHELDKAIQSQRLLGGRVSNALKWLVINKLTHGARGM